MRRETYKEERMSTPIRRSGFDLKKTFRGAGAVGSGILVIVVALLLLFGFNRVNDFEVSVKRNPLTGAVDSHPYRQGLYHSIIRSWTNYQLREVEYPPSGQSERLAALTMDQLTIEVDAAYRYRLNPDSVVHLFLTVGDNRAIHNFVYNTYRSAVRDAVAEVGAANILSRERAGIGGRIEVLMSEKLSPRGIEMTEFFVREIEPPEALRLAIEDKLAREQQVQAEGFQTRVVEEQANQKRAEAEGIRDAQEVIAESLTGAAGQRYLYWRYLEMLGEVGAGSNNLVIAPTEGGVPLFFTPDR
jgi:regulator of protease activity HflC (stomatin/prohibitin superfamily)